MMSGGTNRLLKIVDSDAARMRAQGDVARARHIAVPFLLL